MYKKAIIHKVMHNRIFNILFFLEIRKTYPVKYAKIIPLVEIKDHERFFSTAMLTIINEVECYRVLNEDWECLELEIVNII